MLARFGFCFGVIFLICCGAAAAEDNGALELEPIIVVQHNISGPGAYSLKYRDPQYSAFASPLKAVGLLPVDLEDRSANGATQMRFSLRGSTTRGVAMLLDGQRINEPQAEYYNSDIPFTSEDIKKIELFSAGMLPSPAPDAIGGAINIALKKPQAKDRVLELSYGSHDLKGVLFSASEKINNFGTRLSLENRESRGFREDTDFKQFTLSSSSSLDVSCGSIDINVGYQEKEYGAYDFYSPAKGYLSKEWTKTWLLKSEARLEKGGLFIKPAFLWRRHYDKFMLDKTNVRSNYLNHHRSDLYTPGISFQKEVAPLGMLGLNLEYGEERLNSTNLGKHQRSHTSITLTDDLNLTENLGLELSLRRDDFDGFGDVYYGAARAKLKASEHGSFNLGVSRNIRIPTFTELYYSDPTTIGDAGLSAEKSLSYECGYDYSGGKLSRGIGFFLRQEQDLIDWVKSSSSQEKWQAQNIAAAGVLGTEAYFKIRLNSAGELDFNYAYINKDIDERGYIYKYGPDYARHIFNASANFDLPRGTQTLWLTYKKRPLRDGWWLLGGTFNYELNKKTRFFLRVTNILNSEYQEIEGIPQPGRSLESGVRLEW